MFASALFVVEAPAKICHHIFSSGHRDDVSYHGVLHPAWRANALRPLRPLTSVLFSGFDEVLYKDGDASVKVGVARVGSGDDAVAARGW